MSERLDRPMAGRNCLITGSTRGIGFYTARALALKGAHVILVGHNEAHGEQALERIGEAVGEGAASFFLADLSAQDQIQRLARDVQNRYAHLEVLVNNVGAVFAKLKSHRKRAAPRVRQLASLPADGYIASSGQADWFSDRQECRGGRRDLDLCGQFARGRGRQWQILCRPGACIFIPRFLRHQSGTTPVEDQPGLDQRNSNVLNPTRPQL